MLSLMNEIDSFIFRYVYLYEIQIYYFMCFSNNFYILIRRQDKEKKTHELSVSNIIKDISIILFQSSIFSLSFGGAK